MNRDQLRAGLAQAARPVRAVPALIWLITCLHLAVMLAQTAVFPNVRSPDELKHVDLITQVEQGTAWPWPDPGTLMVADGVNGGRFLRDDTLHDGRQHLADEIPGTGAAAAGDDGGTVADAADPDAVAPPPRGTRPSYADSGGLTPWQLQPAGGAPEDVPNQLIQHPPLYYVLGAALLHAVPDWETVPFDQVWMGLRWLNALLMAPIPILLWASARRLGLPEPLPVAAALVPLAIPEMEHLSSAVNNDNLLVLLGTALTYLLIRVMTGDLTRRTALVIGAVTTAALLTKGFALMFPAWIALAYLVAAIRAPGRRAGAAGALGVAALASLPGVAWWVRNIVLYGAIQPHGSLRTVPELTPVYGWSDGGYRWLSRILERFTTTFFVQDHATARAQDASWWSARVALVVILVGIVVALVRHTIRRVDAVVLVAGVPMLAAIVAKGSWEQFAAFQNIAAAQQGRYLYTGFAGVMLVALAGAAVLRPERRRWVPAGILLLALGLHAAFQFNTWVLYWTPEHASGWGAVREAVSAIGYWYPWPVWVLGLVVAAGVAAAGAVTWSVLRTPVVERFAAPVRTEESAVPAAAR